MGEAGLFNEDSRVELIDGEVYKMAAIGHPHLGCVNRLNRVLGRAVEDRAVLSIQNPVRLDDYSEPEPDVVLLHPRADFYSGATPTGADVFVLIEVSDSSLRFDVDSKAPRYAAAGVPACWMVDLSGDEILVMTGPGPKGFATIHHARRGETLVVEGLPGVEFSVDELLGPA